MRNLFSPIDKLQEDDDGSDEMMDSDERPPHIGHQCSAQSAFISFHYLPPSFTNVRLLPFAFDQYGHYLVLQVFTHIIEVKGQCWLYISHQVPLSPTAILLCPQRTNLEESSCTIACLIILKDLFEELSWLIVLSRHFKWSFLNFVLKTCPEEFSLKIADCGLHKYTQTDPYEIQPSLADEEVIHLAPLTLNGHQAPKSSWQQWCTIWDWILFFQNCDSSDRKFEE